MSECSPISFQSLHASSQHQSMPSTKKYQVHLFLAALPYHTCYNFIKDVVQTSFLNFHTDREQDEYRKAQSVSMISQTYLSWTTCPLHSYHTPTTTRLLSPSLLTFFVSSYLLFPHNDSLLSLHTDVTYYNPHRLPRHRSVQHEWGKHQLFQQYQVYNRYCSSLHWPIYPLSSRSCKSVCRRYHIWHRLWTQGSLGWVDWEHTYR